MDKFEELEKQLEKLTLEELIEMHYTNIGFNYKIDSKRGIVAYYYEEDERIKIETMYNFRQETLDNIGEYLADDREVEDYLERVETILGRRRNG